jgi:mono/diheme cytochrome c family protein
MPAKPLVLSAAITITLTLTACQPKAEHKPAEAIAAATNAHDLVARGEYLIRTTGCNDCHTPGYAENQGNVDKSLWLIGSPLGYNGPWGTTYASNLRLKLQEMDEAQWLAYSAARRTRPIMPDFAVRAMSEEDRRAIYRFVRSLGPTGQSAPAYLPPGKTPSPPYFTLVLPPAPPAPAPSAPTASAPAPAAEPGSAAN